MAKRASHFLEKTSTSVMHWHFSPPLQVGLLDFRQVLLLFFLPPPPRPSVVLAFYYKQKLPRQIQLLQQLLLLLQQLLHRRLRTSLETFRSWDRRLRTSLLLWLPYTNLPLPGQALVCAYGQDPVPQHDQSRRSRGARVPEQSVSALAPTLSLVILGLIAAFLEFRLRRCEAAAAAFVPCFLTLQVVKWEMSAAISGLQKLSFLLCARNAGVVMSLQLVEALPGLPGVDSHVAPQHFFQCLFPSMVSQFCFPVWHRSLAPIWLRMRGDRLTQIIQFFFNFLYKGGSSSLPERPIWQHRQH